MIGSHSNNSSAEMQIGFQVFSERYVSRVVMERDRMVSASAQDTTVFEHMVTEWMFEEGPYPESTWVNFRIEFSFRSIVYAQAASLVFDEISKKTVEAFKERVRRKLHDGRQVSTARACRLHLCTSLLAPFTYRLPIYSPFPSTHPVMGAPILPFARSWCMRIRVPLRGSLWLRILEIREERSVPRQP